MYLVYVFLDVVSTLPFRGSNMPPTPLHYITSSIVSIINQAICSIGYNFNTSHVASSSTTIYAHFILSIFIQFI